MLKRKVLFTVLVVTVATAAILIYAVAERHMGTPEAEQCIYKALESRGMESEDALVAAHVGN